MSALSARRRIESLNSGFCRFNVDVLQQFQQDHGAGQWSVREEHEVSRKDQYCQARDRRLTMGGPAAPAYTGAGRKGQLRNELYECRGVTNCERLCQFAGRTAVKSLRRATLYQDMPYSEGAGIMEVGGQCGDIIAHLCEFVKRDGVSSEVQKAGVNWTCMRSAREVAGKRHSIPVDCPRFRDAPKCRGVRPVGGTTMMNRTRPSQSCDIQ